MRGAGAAADSGTCPTRTFSSPAAGGVRGGSGVPERAEKSSELPMGPVAFWFWRRGRAPVALKAMGPGGLGCLAGSGCWSVLVDESGAAGGALDRLAEFDHGRVCVVRWCSLVEASVRAVLVVVLDELVKHTRSWRWFQIRGLCCVVGSVGRVAGDES